MESLPLELVSFIAQFRPLMRAEVFDTFAYLLCGLLIGEAKHGTVRSSVFAPADYQPQRLSDLFCRHKLSRQALMVQLTQGVLSMLYPTGLPQRLFWLADSTLTEKPFSECVASLGLFHRTKRVVGRAKHLQGHCYVFVAHLYRDAHAKLWASALCGAVLYVKGRSIPHLVGDLAGQLRLPPQVRHVFVVDRGILSRPLVQVLARQGHFALGRARKNQVFYFAPRRQPRRGRQRTYGPKCRVDQLGRRFTERLRYQTMKLVVRGQERVAEVSAAEMLWRGVWAARPCPVRVILVRVPSLSKLPPWYLVTTDLELEPCEAVMAYAGRQHIEVNFDEAKELGLGHYMGRSGEGVRRWPVFISIAQTLLKLVATKALPVALPTLNWSWYGREDTVGQVQRRLREACRPRISRKKESDPTSEKQKKAA